MKKVFFLILICISAHSFSQSQITWTMGMNVASSASGNNHPRVVVDGSGNPLVLWGHSNRAMFSRWNGSSFTTPVMLHPGTMQVAHASWMGPDIASKGDTVYAVFKLVPEGDTSSHIYIVRSFNGGVNFTSPIQVDFIGDSISRFPVVAVDASGNPVVAFMKFNPVFGDARWVVTRSNDYGNSFTTDVKASGWSSVTSTVCDCCPGEIVSSGNNVAVLYRDNNSNLRDSWAGLSVDGGNTFSGGWNMDQNNWMIMSCPASGPDGVIAGDSLFSVFMNGAAATRVYKNISSVSGMSAPVSQTITGTITGLNTQNFPRIDKFGNAMAIVWKQNVSGADQLPILFTNDFTSGFPAAYDTVDLDDITNADVALSNGNVFVVWEDDASGTVKFRKGIFSPVIAAVAERGPNYSSSFPNPVSKQLSVSVKNFLHADLLTTDGRKVLSIKEAQTDIDCLPQGIYFLKIYCSDKTFTYKLFKE